MGDKSAIEWTDATWNPVIGCSRVSEGCRNCYAERTAIRLVKRTVVGATPQDLRSIPGPYAGLVKSTPSGPRWTGEVRLVESVLDAPLRWKRPRRIFVNSMGDLFHEKVSGEWMARVFGVMARCPQHTFQVLTKRPENMRDWMNIFRATVPKGAITEAEHREIVERGWPLPNVWLGVSVEDQATADERIPLLLQTPAAVRWVSYEPALAPVDFAPWLFSDGVRPGVGGRSLDWVVVGGESGPGARPFNLAWAYSTIAQCKAAGVPVFVKQLGAMPELHVAADVLHMPILRGKGGDPAEWPEDLRVREFPK